MNIHRITNATAQLDRTLTATYRHPITTAVQFTADGGSLHITPDDGLTVIRDFDFGAYKQILGTDDDSAFVMLMTAALRGHADVKDACKRARPKASVDGIRMVR
jgi:hypothetical protein